MTIWRRYIRSVWLVLAIVSSAHTATYNWDDSAPIAADQLLVTDDVLILDAGKTISLDTDIELNVIGNAKMQIGATAGAGNVTVKPNDSKNAQLIFRVKANKVLTVELLNDLLFTGNDTGTKPLYVSFRGKGTTQFRMPSGRTISFGPETPGTSTVGTVVSVLMDQELAETNKAQVVFEKWSYEADGINADLTKHSYVRFGQNSALRYLSYHKSGLPETGLTYGYGTVEMDPTNKGSGRLILDIAKGATAGDFRDGAVNICGMRVIGTGPTGGEVEVLNTDMRTQTATTGVQPRQRAGLGAIFRITDNVAFWHHETVDSANYPRNWTTYRTDKNNRRGLVILNNNQSLPRFANNYDMTTTTTDAIHFGSVTKLTDSKFYVADTYQTGFVLGNNGTIDINHNRFIHHHAGAINAGITDGVHVATGATAAGKTHDAQYVKNHNPAALFVDDYVYSTNTTASADALLFYEGNNQAQITMKGHAGLFVSVGASSDTGLFLNETINADGTLKTDGTGLYVAGTIGKGVFDGTSVTVFSAPRVIAADQSLALDGEYAMDIEGPLKVTSTDSAAADPADGFINMPTILLDHAGNELKFETSALASAGTRPLSLEETVEYFRYNTGAIMHNADVEWHGVNYIHNDVARDVSTLPDSSDYSTPSIVGGEMQALKIRRDLDVDPSTWILDYSGPAIYLYDSVVHCHESLVSAGVRWAVREKTMPSTETFDKADNTSKIIMYDRGDKYDLNKSGLGRTFQLGSRANYFADNATLDPIVFTDGKRETSSVRDAFIDVFRQGPSMDPAITSTNKNTIKLRFETAQEPGVAATDKAIHVVYLANRSQINLGWSSGQYKDGTTVYVEADKRYQPWEFDATLLDFVRNDPVEGDPTNANGNRFKPFENGGGHLEVAGENIYFGAGGRHDSKGVLSPANNELAPRSAKDGGGIIYADFGGKLDVSGNYDVLLDTVIARRSALDPKAGGEVNIASDQIIMQSNGRIQAYGFDTALDANPSILQKSVMQTMTIHVPDMPAPEGFAPIKGEITRGGDMMARGGLYRTGRAWASRATASVTVPVPMPTSGLMVLATGDATEQMRISGATRANPLHLYLSGDANGFARVREFVNIKSDPAVLGEGAHAALFLDGGARIGLGSRNYDEYSVSAWNQLGEDKVSLFVNGNAVIDVNDDLLITDRLPLIATENFGKGAVDRVTFYSDVPREIRVTAGCELDLSSFGKGDAESQQIAFAGKVRLVLEPGAKIRFPEIANDIDRVKAPILYFDDEAELIMQGNMDRDEGRWTDGLTGSDLVRVKMLGSGQVWLNKEAKMKIFDSALVGIEADRTTPHTDVTFSLRRRSGMYIGDENSAGGVFQVGNMVDGGGDGTNQKGDGIASTEVNFTLKIDGPGAICHIDREGLMGLGVGTVNKFANPNGKLPSEATSHASDPAGEQYWAWRLQSLHNVKNVTIDIQQGFFDHSRIFDGSSSEASVLALGPIDFATAPEDTTVNGGQYTLRMGDPSGAFIRGGGNVVFIDAGIPHSAPLALSVWSTATALAGTGNSGKYSIMAPSPLIRTYTTAIGGETITKTATSYEFVSRAVTSASTQGNALAELYGTLTMPNYVTYPQKFVAVGSDQFKVLSAYRNSTRLKRSEVRLARKFGNLVDPKQALEKGYLIGNANDSTTGDPGGYYVP